MFEIPRWAILVRNVSTDGTTDGESVDSLVLCGGPRECVCEMLDIHCIWLCKMCITKIHGGRMEWGRGMARQRRAEYARAGGWLRRCRSSMAVNKR
jgi:hypothetical protein